VIYANPPTESKDYDVAYNEAQRLFGEAFGEEEFLRRDDEDDEEVDDE
jgi:hypothetical protein